MKQLMQLEIMEFEIKVAAVDEDNGAFPVHEQNKACKDLAVLQAILVPVL